MAVQCEWRAGSNMLAFGAGFSACQHGIGQGETTSASRGVRLEKHQFVAAFDVVHDEGDVAVEVTSGLDWCLTRMPISPRGEGKNTWLRSSSRPFSKRGETISVSFKISSVSLSYACSAGGRRSMCMPAIFTFRPAMLQILSSLIGHGHGGQFPAAR